jgi:hypothetical protein
MQLPIKTTNGLEVNVINVGTHNHLAGPDFFNARLVIGGQQWAGNVEMHLNASDWYKHGHDDDPNYDNVILHVVWNHDVEIHRRLEAPIPVVELQNLIPEEWLGHYHHLFEKNNRFLTCQDSLDLVPKFTKKMWLEKLFIERLESKYHGYKKDLDLLNNDWEALFFKMLCTNFGRKVNTLAFESLAQSIPMSVFRKIGRDAFQLEAVLLGQSQILKEVKQDKYFRDLRREYDYLKSKYNLTPSTINVQWFKVRPGGYPTIRLSQLAALYQKVPKLFAEIVLQNDLLSIYKLFEVKASSYWDNHHVFDNAVTAREKWITKDFVNLILLNTIIPIKFAYSRYYGRNNTEDLMDLAAQVKPEKNTIINKFSDYFKIKNSLDTQSLLQLKKNYCDQKKCLSCDIGVSLLRGV